MQWSIMDYTIVLHIYFEIMKTDTYYQLTEVMINRRLFASI